MNWIVCGWYTPDYSHWLEPLRARLDSIGAPHDFVEVDKKGGGWQLNTMSKPHHLREATRRHPGKTIIFLDVDCQVTGSLEALNELAEIGGDVGFYLRTRKRKNGDPKLNPRSGTLVVKPTARAQRFVDVWIELSAQFPVHAIDQDSLTVAMGRVPGLSITTLGVDQCALEADRVPSPVILHDRASMKADRISPFARLCSIVRSEVFS
jgi:hypothetical protein